MSREKTLFIIAILVMVLPHLGFPNLVERISLLILGLIIMIFAYSLYFDRKKKVVRKPATKKVSVSPMPPLAKKEVPVADTSGFVFVKKAPEKNDNFNL
jgi:hypothetical protein